MLILAFEECSLQQISGQNIQNISVLSLEKHFSKLGVLHYFRLIEVPSSGSAWYMLLFDDVETSKLLLGSLAIYAPLRYATYGSNGYPRSRASSQPYYFEP